MLKPILKAAMWGAALWGGAELVARLFERDHDLRWDLDDARRQLEAAEDLIARQAAELENRERVEADGPEDLRRDNPQQDGASRRAAQPA